MTREVFLKLQQEKLESGKTLKAFLQMVGVSYSTWSYWRRKYADEARSHGLAPITISHFPQPTAFSHVESSLPSGATLLFPNGLRAHFGQGSEDVLMALLHESLSSHVLP